MPDGTSRPRLTISRTPTPPKNLDAPWLFPRPSIATIQRATCARFGTTPIDLLAARRDRHVVDARHAGMWLARHASYSFPEIGRGFDRHHTSVIHAIHRVDRFLRTGWENAGVMSGLVRALNLTPVAIWPPRGVP